VGLELLSLLFQNGLVSVPFSRGTPPWGSTFNGKQTAISGFSPLLEGDTSVGEVALYPGPVAPVFQSPSRGGHLRGQQDRMVYSQPQFSFSPLLEGDTSVGEE